MVQYILFLNLLRHASDIVRDTERDRNSSDSKDIERAIKFLVDSITKSCHNSKPVNLHSIEVGVLLFDYGYRKESIIAGLFYDVLEDSDAKESDIKSLFGDEVFTGNLASNAPEIKISQT